MKSGPSTVTGAAQLPQLEDFRNAMATLDAPGAAGVATDSDATPNLNGARRELIIASALQPWKIWLDDGPPGHAEVRAFMRALFNALLRVKDDPRTTVARCVSAWSPTGIAPDEAETVARAKAWLSEFAGLVNSGTLAKGAGTQPTKCDPEMIEDGPGSAPQDGAHPPPASEDDRGSGDAGAARAPAVAVADRTSPIDDVHKIIAASGIDLSGPSPFEDPNVADAETAAAAKREAREVAHSKDALTTTTESRNDGDQDATNAASAVGDDDLSFVPFQVIDVPDEDHRWLVRFAWGLGAVGIVGGDPKLGKTIFTDELAVSVASGMPFLGRFEVVESGPVLICSMEGQPWLTTDRINKICRLRGIDPASIPIHVLASPRLRLDDTGDMNRLHRAIVRYGARLLILDPFVRLHLADENSASDVSRVLGGLQVLQRETGVSIAVVHHNRKNVSKNARPGSGLRGSSDIHAWGDTNWYLRSEGEGVTLTVEHRAAASPDPLHLRLLGTEDMLGFEVVNSESVAAPSASAGPTLRDRVLGVLTEAGAAGLGHGAIRERLRVNAQRVTNVLRELEAEDIVEQLGRLWRVRSVPPPPSDGSPERNRDGGPGSVPAPTPGAASERNGGEVVASGASAHVTTSPNPAFRPMVTANPDGGTKGGVSADPRSVPQDSPTTTPERNGDCGPPAVPTPTPDAASERNATTPAASATSAHATTLATKRNTVYFEDALTGLRRLPAACVQTCVTSPPYYGLRDYGARHWFGERSDCDHDHGIAHGPHHPGQVEQTKWATADAAGKGGTATTNSCSKCKGWWGQLGLEPTPTLYVEHLVEILREVRRVLRDDGLLWLNLGDSYARRGGVGGPGRSAQVGITQSGRQRRNCQPPEGIPSKNLIGIPWMVAFALRAEGLYLRSEIIWEKPNCLPESMKDRCTKSHETVFLFSKREKYFYDPEAISEGRNARTVWSIPTRSYSGAHFAVFPPELAERCIKAGTSERGACARCGAPWTRITTTPKVVPIDYAGKWATADQQSSGRRMLANARARRLAGEDHDNPFPRPRTIGCEPTCTCGCSDVVPCLVLDPFAGSGTALMVAKDLGRDFIGVEINEEYRPLIEERVRPAIEADRDCPALLKVERIKTG